MEAIIWIVVLGAVGYFVWNKFIRNSTPPAE